MINKQSPIGFFDSGVGGTSIWKELIHLLPNENTIYLADSINAPYGRKTKDEIIALSEKNTEFLLNQNSKIIVVACNTATTNAISHLREKYDVPFIGIEPAIKPAALQTKTNSVGILATKGTLTSELFEKTSETFAGHINIVEQVGTGLVELIEANQMDTDETTNLLEKYLLPMKKQHIDYLILGCTHYPYLTDKIKNIMGNDIKIIDSGFAVSKQIKNVLKKKNLLNKINKNRTHLLYSNKNEKVLEQLLRDVQVPLHISFKYF